ncbi:putative bifunctional diguanylate cyclase/phosphodiesterase [Oricola sp.]|uniref:putative bifunctional diguanylate cyclase/phosphodiesterase n=1 Tax=Oricola sp. TaxID=1979950 RepID=UPI003BAB119C
MLNQIGVTGAVEMNVATSVVAGLAALAGAGSAHAYFIGSDDTSKIYEEVLDLDPLTGLLSKEGLERKLAKIVQADPPETSGFERWLLISLEIDALRDINEIHGAEIGDSVLRVIAQRVRRLVGDLGPVSRIAGSEYAFAVKFKRDDRELHAVMNAIIDEVARPVSIDSATVAVFCTAGVTQIVSQTIEINKLLRQTKLARANAKAGGLGNWATYHPEMTQSDRYRKWIETELVQAIRDNDFDLVYQSQVYSDTGKIAGYESLLRWKHPTKGIIPPIEFIAVAEQCGLINQIGNWVIRRVCEDAHFFDPDVKIAVNVSPKQLDNPEFVDTLASILKTYDIKPKRIEIEITENVLIGDPNRVRKQFERIRGLGCSIAIDDFGTGYSNLSTLSELSFCKLKLDRSFLARYEDRNNSGPLISTVVNLARALDVQILAEGVETKDQIAMLNAAGCTLMQGFAFGKPFTLNRDEVSEEAAA